MNGLNRFHYTEAFMQSLRDESNQKFIQKYHPVITKTKITVGDRIVVPEKIVFQVIKQQLEKRDAPLGIRSAEAYLKTKYIGVKRKFIQEYLNSLKKYHALKTRPATRKKNRKGVVEGKTQGIFKGNPNTVETDLVELSRNKFDLDWMGEYKHILTAVHPFSGYCWGRLIRNKLASTVAPLLEDILDDCKEKFGKVPVLTHDAGGEFEKQTKAMLTRKGIRSKILDKGKFVEKINSTLQRYMKYLMENRSIRKCLKLALNKMNNIVNRKTNKSPNSLIGTNLRKEVPKRKNKRYSGKHHKIVKYEVGDSVQMLTKSADRATAKMYKSYLGKTWSVPKIIQKKKGNRYKLTGVDWYVPSENLKLTRKPTRNKRLIEVVRHGKPQGLKRWKPES